MRHIPRGKYLAERLRRSPKEAADNHISSVVAGLILAIGALADHAGPMPHPAIDQPQ